MSLRRSDFNKLLIEGKQDLLTITYLMDHFIVWGDQADVCVKGVCSYDGIDDLLGPDEIETILQTPNLKALGIVVDADGEPEHRWTQVRSHCLGQFPALPEPLPEAGLITTNQSGMRLGVWIMPDNKSSGMLESLLHTLVPGDKSHLLTYAKETVQVARGRGASVTEAHLAKSEIHTWLAWEEPPGLQLHQAVLAKVLVPSHPNAMAFAEWFIQVFQLEDLRRPFGAQP